MNVTLIAVVLCAAAVAAGSSPTKENTTRPAETDQKPAAGAAQRPVPDPALAKLATMVGGTWVNMPKDPQKPFPIEYRYELALGGGAVRAVGVIGKGTPLETCAEAFFGWDPQRQCVYYIDFHGAETVYKGTTRVVGAGMETEFEAIVGAPGQFRSRHEFPDPDTIVTTIFGKKDGEWVSHHTIELHRRR
jgi:hypothetical protein